MHRNEKRSKQIIAIAAKRHHERLALTSSFQTQSIPLLHLVSQICPTTPVLFLDTGFHFAETLAFKSEIQEVLGLNIVDLKPLSGQAEGQSKNQQLPSSDPNLCCHLNKVEPLQNELKNFDAWITGIRRDQTSQRSKSKVVSTQNNGTVKICPMLNWSKEDIETYIAKHSLPRHPLHEAGFASIGCAPCTALPSTNDARSGRWAGTSKTECGLHLDPKPPIHSRSENS
ncbi:phosphoadenylyl-sulfate reductase [Rhodopirellula islandica]